MGKWVKGVIAAVLSVGLVTGAWNVWTTVENAKQDAAAAWAAVDSGKVKLAAEKIDKAQYRVLLEQAKRVQGKAVAGVKIGVPRTDTMWLSVALPTTLQPDSTRRATFTDSTVDGTTVAVNVMAPPCCAALEASVRVTVPADTLTIGFITVGSRTVAVASSRTRQVEAVAPFFAPKSTPRSVRFAEVLGDAQTLTLRGGVGLRAFRSWYLTGVVDKRLSTQDKTRFLAGLRVEF